MLEGAGTGGRKASPRPFFLGALSAGKGSDLRCRGELTEHRPVYLLYAGTPVSLAANGRAGAAGHTDLGFNLDSKFYRYYYVLGKVI